jgi:hypothetical protein
MFLLKKRTLMGFIKLQTLHTLIATLMLGNACTHVGIPSKQKEILGIQQQLADLENTTL